MSASFASAMMNARDEGLALTSASLVSSDFIGDASGGNLKEGEHEEKEEECKFVDSVLS
jgi:hypothetical protein